MNLVVYDPLSISFSLGHKLDMVYIGFTRHHPRQALISITRIRHLNLMFLLGPFQKILISN